MNMKSPDEISSSSNYQFFPSQTYFASSETFTTDYLSKQEVRDALNIPEDAQAY